MQHFDHNIGFRENANFFAENCQRPKKIAIITLTPDVIRKVKKSYTKIGISRGQFFLKKGASRQLCNYGAPRHQLSQAKR
jgi:hypothetical protein